MSRGGSGAGKTATCKRVPPPAVPGDAFGTPQHRHSGSSFGSQGYASCGDESYPQPPDTPSHTRDDHSDYGSTVSGVSGVSGASGSLGKSPASGGTFTFPPPSQPLTHKAAVYYHHQLALSDDQGIDMTQPLIHKAAVYYHHQLALSDDQGIDMTQPLTHKAAVYYHHQLALSDDQGIDMTQSPGRDSPGSSSGSAGSGSRHSSASLDSGRASGRMPHHHHAACHCGDTADRVRAMIAQGLPDPDIIHAWLADLQMEEYARLFIEAGYDLPTLTRMTPEDLTAVGIKKPNHRKRLKAELANLNVPDNLPDYIPGSLEEWLRLLRLEEYGPALVAQGYRTVHDVTQLAWEDLEDMGIVRLGHQKKILLAIKRVKDIRADYSASRTGRVRTWLESLPDPPKRQSSQYAPFSRFGQTTVEIHPEKSLPLSLPAYPSSDSLSVSLDSTGLLPPPPAPSSPPRRYEEDKLRTGSDASFKSSSSTESDSIPFANENAGTIKQNRGQIGGRPHTVDYGRAGIGLAGLPPRNPDIKPTTPHEHKEEKSTEPVDVLNDIGNMLANLTDELDAMLEEEKRQGLTETSNV
ncbi:SAM domain (Sterile alpha motif) domain-containing protein [Phthorimaea operculella]|nr:SAM domain (Sterile alpha motif) domain-containing protein [Phthorimaea operculella]